MEVMGSPERVVFAYGVGEEVVVRLRGARGLDVRAGGRLDRAELPAWTIATVIGCLVRDGGRCYAIRFQHGERRILAVVTEGAIDGTA
ncbi:MAG: hypothetical protein HYX50_00455 [Chloroflexi bacterium]|nr:hypothetical protein [Chloroflexota bacterium]